MWIIVHVKALRKKEHFVGALMFSYFDMVRIFSQYSY